MTVVLLLVGLLVFFIGVSHCLASTSQRDLEQAALLPFADDPAAARALEQDTGRVCERVVEPLAESPPLPAGCRFDA